MTYSRSKQRTFEKNLQDKDKEDSRPLSRAVFPAMKYWLTGVARPVTGAARWSAYSQTIDSQSTCQSRGSLHNKSPVLSPRWNAG